MFRRRGGESAAPKIPSSDKGDKTAAPKKPKTKSQEELLKNWTPKKRPPVTEKPSFNRLEQFDYVREVTKKNVWYYRDRLSVPRGPCTLPVLRECWVNGVIDENTLIWGQGLIDWLPAKNIRTLIPQIRTPEGIATSFHSERTARGCCSAIFDLAQTGARFEASH